MGLTAGIDVGGTKIAGGVVDEHGKILATARRESPATDTDAIERAIEDLVAELRVDHDIVAVLEVDPLDGGLRTPGRIRHLGGQEPRCRLHQ